MRFEWNPVKAAGNLTKHGLSFEEAITAFDDPHALVAPDPIHSSRSEVREWLIGRSDSGVVVVVFTIRELGRIFRVISARRASRKERRRYEESKAISV